MVYTIATLNSLNVYLYLLFSVLIYFQDIVLLEKLRVVSNYQPVCFIVVPKQPQSVSPSDSQDKVLNGVQNNIPSEISSSNATAMTDSNIPQVNGDITSEEEETQSHDRDHIGTSKCKSVGPKDVFEQLCDIGYLNESPGMRAPTNTMISDYYEVNSELIDHFEHFTSRFVFFVQQNIQRYLVNAVTVLSNAHERCLRDFVISAFDMAREMMITPKKLDFARKKEQELYKSLMDISVEKTDEIRVMIGETILSMRAEIVEKAVEYEFLGKRVTYFVKLTGELSQWSSVNRLVNGPCPCEVLVNFVQFQNTTPPSNIKVSSKCSRLGEIFDLWHY